MFIRLSEKHSDVAQANKQYSNHHFSLILRHFSRSAGHLHFLSLSFVNRSFLVVQTCKVGKICRIMPRFYATMQALCCVVPWQTIRTLIIPCNPFSLLYFFFPDLSFSLLSGYYQRDLQNRFFRRPKLTEILLFNSGILLNVILAVHH